MWKKRKNASFYEKYKPDEWLYISIIVIFSIIRFIPVSSGSANFDDAVNDLAVGCVASTVVASLIEIANCSNKNKEQKKRKEWFLLSISVVLLTFVILCQDGQ